MRILLFATLFLVSINMFSKDIVNSWACDDILITMYDDNTCDVGALTYEVKVVNGHYVFHLAGYVFLMAELKNGNSLLVRSTDNSSDKKYFVNCH